MHQWLNVLRRSQDFKILSACFVVVMAWRAGLELINQFIVPNIIAVGSTPTPGASFGLSRWFLWDGSWYSLITEKGYVVLNNFQGYEPVVFFPGFPALVDVLSTITRINYVYLGLFINVALTALICFYLYKTTVLIAARQRIKIPHLPELSVALLLLSPSSFFFAAYYADALLVLAFTASIYYALNNAYLPASLFAAIATLTKSIGVVLIPVLLILMFVQYRKPIIEFVKNNIVRMVWVTAISSSGLIAYMSYLYFRFGDPLLFYKMQQYWDREVSGFFLNNLWQIYYQHIPNPSYYGSRLGYLYHMYAMIVPIAAIACIIYLLVRHRFQYSWLAALIFLIIFIPLSTGTILSDNRYALVATPLIAYFSVYIYGQYAIIRKLTPLALFFSTIFLFIMTTAFLSFRFAG